MKALMTIRALQKMMRRENELILLGSFNTGQQTHLRPRKNGLTKQLASESLHSKHPRNRTTLTNRIGHVAIPFEYAPKSSRPVP